eukprot:tig00000826_g4597.t1
MVVPALSYDEPPVGSCSAGTRAAVSVANCFPTGSLGLDVVIDSYRLVAKTAHFEITVKNTGASDAAVSVWVDCVRVGTTGNNFNTMAYGNVKVAYVAASGGEAKVTITEADQ